MVKKVSFGKVDGYGNGRRTCEVELEFGFREYENQEPYFTVCASLWNNLHTDIIRGGQCVDDLAKEFKLLDYDPMYSAILDMWKKYHLKKISEIPSDDVKTIYQLLAAA